MAAVTRLGLWPLRISWVALALVAGAPVGEALASRSTPVTWSIASVAWVGWAGALAAMLVPRTTSLTLVRIVVPAAWVGAIATVAADPTSTVAAVSGLCLASVAVLAVFAPWTTDAFVDGSSYGPERRIALRTPPALVVLAIVAWAATVAAALTGPLLVASGLWGVGAATTVAGAGVVAVGVRSLHQLSRRWLVLVPAGLVVHDPITMPEAQLFLRQTMERIGPAERAPADGDLVTEDLTAGSAGLVMELVLREPVDLLVRQGRRAATDRSVRRVLFSPSLPSVLLAEAGDRRLPVG